MLKKYVLHPFLFILYSVLSLYASNTDRTQFSEVYRTILITISAAGILLLFFRALARSWYSAGLVSTVIILLFTTYGHVYNILSGKGVLGQANIIAAIWAALLIVLGWASVRLIKNPKPLNEILNVVSIVLIVFPLLQLGSSVVVGAQPGSTANTLPEEYAVVSKPAAPRPPDIYYIILDEYGRADVLDELMSYDNSEIIRYLDEKGFYVSEKSHANYIITHFSLASSLNARYLDDLAHPDSQEAEGVIRLLRNNNAVAFLKQNGYEVITFSTGYHFSELHNADYRFAPKDYINDFEMSYIESTAMALGVHTIYNARYRSLLLNAFDGLENAGKVDPEKPKFVFAHILAAHVPFVFGPNGEAVDPWSFAYAGEGSRPYTTAYKDQLTFVNKKLMATIDAILAQSEVKPVIIIQSDHGPESLLDWSSADNTCLKERTSIFNAYYFPDADYKDLYSTITPVNSFRVVFNQHLGTNLPLLDDKTYFSTWERPLNFIDVTDRTGTCKTETTSK